MLSENYENEKGKSDSTSSCILNSARLAAPSHGDA